jgi:methionine synthase II (cobalamin-independent)
VDARNTRLETVRQLTGDMKTIVKRGGETWPDCWLTPSAALEFLPHRSAIAKMQRLTAAVAQFTNSSVAAA